VHGAIQFFFEKGILVFFRDFENLPTISWMEKGERVDHDVEFQILSCFANGIVAASLLSLPRISTLGEEGEP